MYSDFALKLNVKKPPFRGGFFMVSYALHGHLYAPSVWMLLKISTHETTTAEQ